MNSDNRIFSDILYDALSNGESNDACYEDACYKIFNNFSINDKLIVYINNREHRHFAIVKNFSAIKGKLCLVLEVVAPYIDRMVINPYDAEYEVINVTRKQE